MANILTPLSLWSEFDSSLPTEPTTHSKNESEGIMVERISFWGRDTGAGRVRIAAAYAYNAENPDKETVIIFPDSTETIDEELLKFFVLHGYSALMVDYRGKWEGCEFFTDYPVNIEYANTAMCARRKDYVDESADKTTWYEWVSVGIFARKYIEERGDCQSVAAVGIRDGGEIVWKLGLACELSCIVPVCAAGWKAYTGINKYLSEEPTLNEERYRFIAGIDSQAYAPYVKCPVLMLCSTNDHRFDYDRAYDTFSRINPEFLSGSAISYSVHCNSGIGIKSTADMFMFLAKYLKNRQVFIPRPATLTVESDEDDNLIARTVFDTHGEVDCCKMYISEDNIDSVTREWDNCALKRKVSAHEQEFYLNVYEKTSTLFVFCNVKYTNGFTVWSKMAVKKISGKFRNMVGKSHVIYTDKSDVNGFTVAYPKDHAIGGVFFIDERLLPHLEQKSKGIKGLYSVCGLTTYRMTNPKYSPVAGNLLSIDIFGDVTCDLNFILFDYAKNEEYIYTVKVIGGVWQNFILECKMFKSDAGTSPSAFTSNMIFTVDCPEKFAINNMMWL